MKIVNKIKKRWRKWDERRFSIFKTIYFNFHYLPWRQAYKLPIHLRNVKFGRLSGSLIIDAEKIVYGMVKIGAKGRNFWCPNNTSTIDIWGGKLVFVGGSIFHQGTHIKVGKKGLMEIGKGCTFASNCNIVCYYHLVVGADTHLGWDVTIMDTNWHPLLDIYSKTYTKMMSPVKVGNHCWIGAKSSLLPGTKLPDNTIVSYGSIVNIRLKEEHQLLGGVPAKVVGNGYSITSESFKIYHQVTKEMLKRRKSKYNDL